VIVPEILGLVSEQLKTLTQVVDNLELNHAAIRRNIDVTRGAIFSEFVLNELIKSGMGRGEAHRLLDSVAEEARLSDSDFLSVLSKNEAVTSRISVSKLKSLLDPQVVLSASELLVSKAIADAETALRLERGG
jgi:adenylosuccinate lyase